MNRLKDKVVVVTGAGSGIGRGIAIACATEGANMAINYRRSVGSANNVVREIQDLGQEAISIQADLSLETDIQQLIETTLTHYSHIDVWVNNAGADILTGSGAAADRQQKLEHLIDVDLKGTISACWNLVPVFNKQGYGVIVNMGWDLAWHGLEGNNPQIFAAAKAGVTGFTRSFAKSIGPSIRANVVSPGWIATSFAEEHMEQGYFNARIAEIPLGRFGRPEDVAAAVVFLSSDESSYICGEVIKVNGGLV